MSIIFADDDNFIRNIANLLLKQLSPTLHITENGQEAIDAYHNDSSCKIIILDLNMPVLDGIEACKTLRAEGCALPILALSADDDDETRADCMSAGFTALIGKPLKKNDIAKYM